MRGYKVFSDSLFCSPRFLFFAIKTATVLLVGYRKHAQYEMLAVGAFLAVLC